MKFFKGVIVGTMFTVGTAMLYKESIVNMGNKFIKKVRKIAKKIGVM